MQLKQRVETWSYHLVNPSRSSVECVQTKLTGIKKQTNRKENQRDTQKNPAKSETARNRSCVCLAIKIAPVLHVNRGYTQGIMY